MDNAEVGDIYNYRRIAPMLSTAGQPTVAELGAVAREGFEVVINLALHDDPRYSLPDEAGVVESLGMTYVHIPVLFDAPAADDLLAYFAVMEKHQGKKLLVHCAANKRVTAFLGLYRVVKQSWDIEPAFALMKDVWEPSPVWSSFISAMLTKLSGR